MVLQALITSCLFATFPFIVRVSKKIMNKLIVFKLFSNILLVGRVFLSFFFIKPGIYNIPIRFTSIVFKVVLDIGRKMKMRDNGFKKRTYILTAPMVFRNDCI
jgi:hypothetical protein